MIAEQQREKLNTYYYEAIKQLALSNKENAETNLMRCVEIDPKHHASWYLLGTIEQFKGDYRQALNYYALAVKLDPSNRWYLQHLAEIQKALRLYEESAKTFEQLFKLEPKDFEHSYNAAIMWGVSGNYNKAIKIYNKIEKAEGINERSSLSKEEIYLQKKDYKNAIKTLNNLSEAFPREIKYIGMLADLYMQRKQVNKALEIYYQIAATHPESGLSHMALAGHFESINNDDSAMHHLKLAMACSDVLVKDKMEVLISRLQRIKKNDDRSIENVEDLLTVAKSTDQSEPNFLLISAKYNQAIERWEEARIDLEKALKLQPNIQNAHAELIELDIKLNDDASLVKHAHQAISYFPHVTGFYLYAAQANYRSKNYIQTIELCKQGIETAPIDRSLNVLLYTTLGDASHFAKQYNTSDSAFEQVLLFDADNYYTMNNWAYFLALRGDKLSKAEEMSKRTVDRFPDNYTYLDTYGYVLYKNKKYNEAVSYLKKAVESNESSGEVLEHYADALYKTGNTEEALKYWKLAQAAGGASELIEQKIKNQKTE